MKNPQIALLVAVIIAIAALSLVEWRSRSIGNTPRKGIESSPANKRSIIDGSSEDAFGKFHEPTTGNKVSFSGRLGTPTESLATANSPATTPNGVRPEMPERIKILLRKQYRRPSSADILAIQPSDADYLVNLYRAEPILTNRIAAMYALAATGDQRALVLFENTLSSEFAGQSLPYTDVKMMVRHLEAIGMLARSSDAAFAYLAQGTTPGEWQQAGRRAWRSADRTEELTNRSLARGSVRAIGMSGRTESLAVIERLSQKSPAEVYPVSSALVDAVFFNAYIADHGNQDWIRSYFDGFAFEVFAKWTQETEQGRRWQEWARQVETAAGSLER